VPTPPAALARALLGDFARLPQAEQNLLALFLHPEADQTCPERKATVAELTAMLRAQVAADPGHPGRWRSSASSPPAAPSSLACGPATMSGNRSAARCASGIRWPAN
jgi:hypothetical protein